MQVRLAFSVATAIRPDILIVDEALSVGDTYFQHKSFERIREFRKKGTTLLIVSHDKSAIQSICDRAILLSNGEIAFQGEPEAVMDYYNAMLADRESLTVQQKSHGENKIQTVSGSQEAFVEEICLLNERNEPIETVNVGQPVSLRIKVRTKVDIPELVLGYVIKDRLGQPVFGTNTYHLNQQVENIMGESTLTFSFRFHANMGVGNYSIATALHTSDNHISKNYEWRDLALIFSVTNSSQAPFVGVAWIPPILERSK
ncbi:nickel import ATP-binding protein NikE [compost metagenome]